MLRLPQCGKAWIGDHRPIQEYLPCQRIAALKFATLKFTVSRAGARMLVDHRGVATASVALAAFFRQLGLGQGVELRGVLVPGVLERQFHLHSAAIFLRLAYGLLELLG